MPLVDDVGAGRRGGGSGGGMSCLSEISGSSSVVSSSSVVVSSFSGEALEAAIAEDEELMEFPNQDDYLAKALKNNTPKQSQIYIALEKSKAQNAGSSCY